MMESLATAGHPLIPAGAFLFDLVIELPVPATLGLGFKELPQQVAGRFDSRIHAAQHVMEGLRSRLNLGNVQFRFPLNCRGNDIRIRLDPGRFNRRLNLLFLR